MPPGFTRDFRPVLLRIPRPAFWLTPTGLSPSMAWLSSHVRLHQRGGYGRVLQHYIPTGFPQQVQFALTPFRSPLLRGSLLVSFPPPTEMLHFGGFPLPEGSTTGYPRGRKSHSAIPGSKAAYASPGLIAARHGLPRLPSRAIPQTA